MKRLRPLHNDRNDILIYFFLFLLIPFSLLYSWRPYSVNLPVSTANAVAAATVGEAEGASGIRVNPAGLVQLSAFSLSYDIFSSVMIKDLFVGQWDIAFDTFPFIGLGFGSGVVPFGLDLELLFEHRHVSRPLQIRAFRLSSAFAILPNLSFGIATGPILGFEGSSRSLGWNVRAGILWKVFRNFQWGTVMNTPFRLDWLYPINGASLTEVYPLIAETGFTWQVRPQLRLYFSLEYVEVADIRYVLDGTDQSPNLGEDWREKFHPKIGVRFLDPIFGSLLGFGVLIQSDYNETGSETQYLFTAGVQAHAEKALISASWVDSYLLRMIFPKNTGEERIHLGVSFEWH